MGSPIESLEKENLEKKNGQAAIRWTDIDGKDRFVANDGDMGGW